MNVQSGLLAIMQQCIRRNPFYRAWTNFPSMLSIVGVRAQESSSVQEYDYENDAKAVKTVPMASLKGCLDGKIELQILRSSNDCIPEQCIGK